MHSISTSSVNSLEKYGRPWSIGERSIEDVWKKLTASVDSNKLLKLVEINDENHYIRAEAKSAVPPTGIDDIEFLLSPTDKIITYRSNSRDLVTVYGIAGPQVVGDGGSHKNRLESIRRSSELKEMGVSDDENEYFKEIENSNFLVRMQRASEPSDINFLDNSVPDEE